MTSRRLQTVAAVFVYIGGVVLLIEICRAAHLNVWWLSRSVLMEQRFAFYLWSSVGLAAFFVLLGTIGVTGRHTGGACSLIEVPLAICLLAAFIFIAHGWRIRTDVGPADGISSLSELPISLRLLADGWFAGGMITLVAGGALLYMVRVVGDRRGGR
jgi:hypothetical protein